MAQHVDVHISIEGEQISPFSYISIQQDIHQHHAFEVVLPVDAFENGSRSILQQSKNHIGKLIIIRFGPKLFEKKHPDNQFMGLITSIGARRSGLGERQVVIRGSSPTVLMDGAGQCRSFTQKSLKDIAEATLEKIPRSLESRADPVFRGSIPYVVQFNESNWEFLQRMAARHGEWCFYDGTKLLFGKLPKEKVIDLPFGEDLFSFEFALRLIPTNTKAISYNYLENKKYESVAGSAAISDLDEFGRFVLDQSAKIYSQEPSFASDEVIGQQRDLDDIILQQKSSSARNMVMASGDSDNPHLNVGSVINITGEAINEDDYGRFIITSIVHNISGTYSYSNDFSAIPAENQSPPSPIVRKPSANVQPAIVIENEDPEGLGRVKAQFYWQEAAETTPWIRVANTMAGNGKNEVHGFYFIPEIDDEVLIGFEDNNPDKPFVLGSVYHKNVAPTEWQDSDNQIKVIRTKNGNQIYLLDKDGKEEIKIFNKDVGDPTNIISLSMEGDGKITIETKGELVLKAKSIDMKADEEIKITSGKATDIKAMDLNMNAQSSVKLKGQQMDLESSMANVKASGQLDIDGGGMASVKAGVIKLN